MKVNSVQEWDYPAAPMAWVGDNIFYHFKNAKGLFRSYSGNYKTMATKLIYNAAYPATTNQGIGDVTPDGKFALMTIERSNHWPLADGTSTAFPGSGTYNDLWLHDLSTNTSTKIRDIVVSKANALIWPRFNKSGTRVVWAEQWLFGLPFGSWRLHVADLVVAPTPKLTNIKTFKSDGFLEPYGFSPDDKTILFAADKVASTNWSNLQIMSMSSELTGTPVRLSPKDKPTNIDWSNYNEFAFWMPGRNKIIYARSVGAFYYSLEYWTMNPDGTGSQQLTSFSIPWSPWYHGFPSLAGSLAFNPNNNNQFIAAFGANYDGDYKAALVTVDESS